jgi:hypothetical protein
LLKYIGRSATTPAQLGVAVAFTVTLAASDAAEVVESGKLRSLFTDSVVRLAGEMVTDTVLVAGMELPSIV